MSQRKSIQDWRIAASEAAAQAHLYSACPGAGFYSRQADNACRCAMRSKTVAQARKYAERAAELATKARLMAEATPAPRKPWHVVQAEAAELYR